jgi:hypothetical protein
MEKQALSIKVSPNFYSRLKSEIGRGRIGEFIEKVVSRELDQGQKEFQQKLIADYKAVAKNKKIQKELEV